MGRGMGGQMSVRRNEMVTGTAASTNACEKMEDRFLDLESQAEVTDDMGTDSVEQQFAQHER